MCTERARQLNLEAPELLAMENKDGNFVLSGIFATKGFRIHLLLTKDNISWEIVNVPKSQTIIPLRCLIAAHLCNCSTFKPTKPFQCDFCRAKVSKTFHPLKNFTNISCSRFMRLHFAVPSGRHAWKLDSQIFQPLENTNLEDWLNAINNALLDLKRPKNLLVFVNPFGGKKKGIKVYENKAAHIFRLAGINTDVVVTQRPNHAKELIADVDIHLYDGIICVGGDGMFSEILNSVLLKTQNDKGINVNDLYNPLVTPRVPLGIIPAGSTNAAVNSITGSSDPISCSLLIVMGDCTGVDVCGVYESGKLMRYAVTFLSYGFFGDVIRDSEKLRWMGPKRYSITSFKKILCRKLYEGELQLQTEVPINCGSSLKTERCFVDCDTCLKTSHKRSCESDNVCQKVKWVAVRSQFIAVSAAVVSCSCHKASKGISPSQHLGNGYCDVIVVRKCSRLNYLRFLLRVAHQHKDPFKLDFVDIYRVREFKFNPFVIDDKTPATGCVGLHDNWQELNTSVWNCDGEVINEPSVTAKMHCQLLNVFGRGYEDRKKGSIWRQCFDCFKKL